MQKLSKTVKLLALVLLSFDSQAQKFEWVNFFNGKSHQRPLSINVDDSGNQYSTFQFWEQIKFDTVTLNNKSLQVQGLVVKQDKNGKMLWYKTMSGNGKINFNWILPLASTLNSKGNLVVIVSSGNDVVIGADTIKRKDTTRYYNFFRLEFNNSGKLINGLHLIAGVPAAQNYLKTNLITTDKNDDLYISVVAQPGNSVKVYDAGGTTILNTATSSYINLKFSNSGKKFEWASYLPNNTEINAIKVDIDGNLYVVGRLAGNISYMFKGKKINNPQTMTGVVFIWDKNGKDKNWFWMEASSKFSTFYNVTVHDSNSVLVSGRYLGDSAKFGAKWYKNDTFGSYQFLAMYDAKWNAKWIKTEDTSYRSDYYYIDDPNDFESDISNYKDSFYYVSIYMPDHYNKPIIFDGQKYLPNPKGYGINMKLDDKGNILWAFRSGYPFVSMGTDKINNLYFAGYGLDDTIKFGSYKSYSVNYDGFIGKTYDYAIYRGDIYAGPYCAGDSIFVPYTKSGVYADTNIFFAEISDEFGNFTGKEREIGRLKTNANGTIRGALPMFKVASSGNYRIRIRSTSPQAQSFYKFDKLRLLIYSRDKADPGPPEYICPGDTIQLNTFGGTKWTWSPKYRMDNPNLRQPMVWPLRDTVYKIIIADSSGCGAPDTAYKKIYVRQSFKDSLTLRDTSVCFGQQLFLYALGKSDDMSRYQFSWYLDKAVISKSAVLVLNTGSYFKPEGEKKMLKFVVHDICGITNDSIAKLITVIPGPIASFSFGAACNITPTDFTFTGTKPQAPVTTIFNWNFNNEGSSSLENPSKLFTNTGTKKIKLLVASNNGCKDSLTKTIIIKPQPKASFTATDVCESDSVAFVNKSKDATGYNWKFGDGQTNSKQNPKHKYRITSTTTFNVTLVALLAKGCNDSVTNPVTIHQNPNSDFTSKLNGSTLELTAKTGGTKYQWKFGTTDSASTTAINYTHTQKSSDQNKVCLKVTNLAGCISEICKDVTLDISKIDNPSGFKIYPNPNTGNFTIEIDNHSNDFSIEMYDLIGNIIKTVETNPNKKSYSIEMNAANGIYVVKVRNDGIVWNQKVIINN